MIKSLIRIISYKKTPGKYNLFLWNTRNKTILIDQHFKDWNSYNYLSLFHQGRVLIYGQILEKDPITLHTEFIDTTITKSIYSLEEQYKQNRLDIYKKYFKDSKLSKNT